MTNDKEILSTSKLIQVKVPLMTYKKMEQLKKHGFIKNFASYGCEAIVNQIRMNEQSGDFKYIEKKEKRCD